MSENINSLRSNLGTQLIIIQCQYMNANECKIQIFFYPVSLQKYIQSLKNNEYNYSEGWISLEKTWKIVIFIHTFYII